MLPVLPCRTRLSRNMILRAAALLTPPPPPSGEDDWDSISRVKSSTVGGLPATGTPSRILVSSLTISFGRSCHHWPATIISRESLSARDHSARSCATTRAAPRSQVLRLLHFILRTVAPPTCLVP
jgi:hypothetical protein